LISKRTRPVVAGVIAATPPDPKQLEPLLGAVQFVLPSPSISCVVTLAWVPGLDVVWLAYSAGVPQAGALAPW
jgi:hypothetical protein